jgi:hypothetical protein
LTASPDYKKPFRFLVKRPDGTGLDIIVAARDAEGKGDAREFLQAILNAIEGPYEIEGEGVLLTNMAVVCTKCRGGVYE